MFLSTQEEITEKIKQYVQEHNGEVPCRREFLRWSEISENQIYSRFGTWNNAVKSAGFQPNLSKIRIADDTLLEDWGNVVRKMRKIPPIYEYPRKGGKYDTTVFRRHFGGWSVVPKRFLQFAEGKPEWADVVSVINIAKPREPEKPVTGLPVSISSKSVIPQYRHKKLLGTTYGEIINFRGLLHAPVNEMGVVFLFGMIADELGYKVEVVQGAFPDCKAKRRIGKNKWQDVSIEFEFESINFRDHGHSTKDCDVIVCWEHNWPDCPEEIEVLALVTEIAKLQANKSADTND
jgi:hypothetical protein